MKWLLVGLGNPGDQYLSTRHNAGFMVMDEVARRLGAGHFHMDKKTKSELVQAGQVLLIKPQTFMNRSGEAVQTAMSFYKLNPEQVIVVHDDLDISMGTVKAGIEKGPKVHNGLTSIEQSLGTTRFWRVRVGVDGRGADERSMWPGDKYVLLPLSAPDKAVLGASIMTAANKVEEILHGALNQSV